MGSGWLPILSGSDAAASEQVVLQIADGLRNELWSPDRIHHGLAGGSAGLAIFYHVLSERWPSSDYARERDRYWNGAIDSLANAAFAGPNLYSGYTGVGWVTAFLSSFDPESEEADDIHVDLEESLLEQLRSMRNPADYDLINGPAGWGLYALERWPSPRATVALELIVDFFHERAERVPEGIRWHTAPGLLPDWQRKKSPHGYYNLGLAHGVPGVWVLLAQALVRGIRPGVSEELLEESVRWGLSQRWQDGPAPVFPNVVDGAPQGPGTRLAWCYGDLGVAAALFVAGHVSQREEWIQEGCSIARRVSGMTQELSRNPDAALCHGAAGLGHIFNRFYQATGEEVFSAAAAYWIGVALGMRRDGIGPGGYAAWRNEAKEWVPMPGLLEGSAGIALALLAAVENREPNWDRFLSISPVPFRSGPSLVKRPATRASATP